MDRILTREEAFEYLKKWSSDAFFRAKNIEKKFSIETIERSTVHVLRVRTQFEKRGIHAGQSFYYGGSIDNDGDEPSINAMMVRPPNGYEDTTISMRVPYSEHVEDCPNCSSGMVTCSWCFGSGSQSCTWCNGSGSVDESYTETESSTDSDGNTQYNTVWNTRSTTCTSCCGGTVTCSFCFGSGTQTCGNCDGTAAVLICLVMDCKYSTTTYYLVPDNKSELTSEQIRTAKGNRMHRMEIVGDSPGERLLAPVDDAGLKQHLIELKAEAKLKDSGEDKKWYQELSIDEVPIHRVVLRNNRGQAAHTAWIFGTDNQVHAPEMPVAKSRIVFVVLAAILGFMGVLWVYTHQAPSVPPAIEQPATKLH